MHCAESLKPSNVLFMNTKRTQLPNINFITCFKALWEFVKSFKCDDIHKFCILLSDEHTCLI